jgi:hypothetical protein
MYHQHSELYWGHTKKSHGLTPPICPLSWSASLSSVLLNIPFLLCRNSVETNVGSDNFCYWQTLWAGWQELEGYNGRQIWRSHDVVQFIYRMYFSFTKCHQVGDISTLYLGTCRFRSWPRDMPSWLRLSVVFLRPSRKVQGSTSHQAMALSLNILLN